MPDEHASEFAETLAGLKSGDAEPSYSQASEFADIIDEEEVEQAKSASAILRFSIFVVALLWVVADPDSFFRVIF